MGSLVLFNILSMSFLYVDISYWQDPADFVTITMEND